MIETDVRGGKKEGETKKKKKKRRKVNKLITANGKGSVPCEDVWVRLSRRKVVGLGVMGSDKRTDHVASHRHGCYRWDGDGAWESQRERHAIGNGDSLEPGGFKGLLIQLLKLLGRLRYILRNSGLNGEPVRFIIYQCLKTS